MSYNKNEKEGREKKKKKTHTHTLSRLLLLRYARLYTDDICARKYHLAFNFIFKIGYFIV